MRTDKKIQLVHNWIFIPVWNECRSGYFKKPVEINKGRERLRSYLQKFEFQWNSNFRKFCWVIRTQPISVLKSFLLYHSNILLSFFPKMHSFSDNWPFFQWNEDGSSNPHLFLVKISWISGYFFLHRKKEILTCIQTSIDPSWSYAILFLLDGQMVAKW